MGWGVRVGGVSSVGPGGLGVCVGGVGGVGWCVCVSVCVLCVCVCLGPCFRASTTNIYQRLPTSTNKNQ